MSCFRTLNSAKHSDSSIEIKLWVGAVREFWILGTITFEEGQKFFVTDDFTAVHKKKQVSHFTEG